MKIRLNCLQRIAAVIALLLGAIGGVSAQVDVSATYHKIGGLYQYQFSVVNNSAFDLDFVSVYVPGLPFDISNLVAPTGFDINSSIVGSTGYVNFVQDLDENTSQSFAPSSTVQFFTFDSTSLIAPAKIEAQAVNPAGGIVTFGGNVTGLTAPEPATLPLFATVLGTVSCFAVRRRKVCGS